MKSFSEITQTKGWKNFMAKLYGIGAAVVIIGALFKIMHWPGASAMLIAGLGTEAVIFFFSAFEPIHEEIDWTLAYPELAGVVEPRTEPLLTGKLELDGAGGGGLSEIDKALLKSVDSDTSVFERLGQGIKNLAETSSNLSDISNATVATNEYAQSMNAASKSVGELSNSSEALSSSMKESADSLSYAVGSLTDSYSKVSENVASGGDKVAGAYQHLADQLSVNVDFSQVNTGNESYNEKIGVLNKNLSALNAVFELQLEGGLDKMMDDLKGAVEESHKYRSEVSKLATRLEALNNVYGNMLTAMNVKMG